MVIVTVLICRIPKFLATNFGDITLEQLVFHLTANVGGSPAGMVKEIARELVIKPLVAGLLVHVLLPYVPDLFRRSARWGLVLMSTLLSTLGLMATASTINLHDSIDAITNPVTGDWVQDWYHWPAVQPRANVEPPNLIWIYVESLESKRVPQNSRLRQLAKAHFSPQKFQVLPGTQWTLAGMIGSQCGVPLMPVGMFGGNNFDQITHPLQNAKCVGDVLKLQGYHGEFIGGADHAFSGKGNFLRSHGFDEVFGKVELSQHYPLSQFPEDWWGYPDATVFDFARQRISALHTQKQPFFLSVLTLDTHGPAGKLTSACRQKGFKDQIGDIFLCSLQEVEAFIGWLEQQGITRDTVVVVTGDHPFMEPKPSMFSFDHLLNPGISKFQKSTQSDVFTFIMSPDKGAHHPPTMNHFDFFPTVLSALNLNVVGNQAGLGANLFEAPSLNQGHDVVELKRRLRTKSAGYLELWRSPDPL